MQLFWRRSLICEKGYCAYRLSMLGEIIGDVCI